MIMYEGVRTDWGGRKEELEVLEQKSESLRRGGGTVFILAALSSCPRAPLFSFRNSASGPSTTRRGRGPRPAGQCPPAGHPNTSPARVHSDHKRYACVNRITHRLIIEIRRAVRLHAYGD